MRSAVNGIYGRNGGMQLNPEKYLAGVLERRFGKAIANLLANTSRETE